VTAAGVDETDELERDDEFDQWYMFHIGELFDAGYDEKAPTVSVGGRLIKAHPKDFAQWCYCGWPLPLEFEWSWCEFGGPLYGRHDDGELWWCHCAGCLRPPTGTRREYCSDPCQRRMRNARERARRRAAGIPQRGQGDPVLERSASYREAIRHRRNRPQGAGRY
jgi:hypothetical protein